MTPATLETFFFWCMLINFGVLFLAWFAYLFFHELIYKVHGRLFHISKESFDLVFFSLMISYKSAIFLFNVAPWIALNIMNP